MASEMPLEVAMWKTVLAGTTALVIAGATLAYAQPGPNGLQRMQRWHPSAADITAFADARIAALHAGLELTPDQEKNWPAMESALKDLAKQRTERGAARAGASAEQPKSPIDRLAARAQELTTRGVTLKKLADAAGPLYNSLTPDQKHRFMILAQLGGHHRNWRGHRDGRGQEGGWHHWQRAPQNGPLPQ
jgi:zinc resistance-associated protein